MRVGAVDDAVFPQVDWPPFWSDGLDEKVVPVSKSPVGLAFVNIIARPDDILLRLGTQPAMRLLLV